MRWTFDFLIVFKESRNKNIGGAERKLSDSYLGNWVYHAVPRHAAQASRQGVAEKLLAAGADPRLLDEALDMRLLYHTIPIPIPTPIPMPIPIPIPIPISIPILY